MSVSRFPGWVYGSGAEPDPRFSLANERTFLAWIRTALALMAVGVAVEALPVAIEAWARTLSATAFLGLGALAAVQAWLGWALNERALRRSATLPGSRASAVLGGGVVLASAVLAYGLFG